MSRDRVILFIFDLVNLRMLKKRRATFNGTLRLMLKTKDVMWLHVADQDSVLFSTHWHSITLAHDIDYAIVRLRCSIMIAHSRVLSLSKLL